MEKVNKKKILKQLRRLCEKQYRKGFQQGYYSCVDGIMTKEQVDEFRLEGILQNYNKVKYPTSNIVESKHIDSLLMEIKMGDYDDLKNFILND